MNVRCTKFDVGLDRGIGIVYMFVTLEIHQIENLESGLQLINSRKNLTQVIVQIKFLINRLSGP